MLECYETMSEHEGQNVSALSEIADPSCEYYWTVKDGSLTKVLLYLQIKSKRFGNDEICTYTLHITSV